MTHLLKQQTTVHILLGNFSISSLHTVRTLWQHDCLEFVKREHMPAASLRIAIYVAAAYSAVQPASYSCLQTYTCQI